MSAKIRTRIAPTPSGCLHIGNAFNFLLTEHLASMNAATLRLRIDDLDALRTRGEYVSDIFQNLRWLGISWDDGPKNEEEQKAIFLQSARLAHYNAFLEKLTATGFVFACSCSRKDLERTSEDGQYMGTCLRKAIPLGMRDVAWRIQTPREGATVHFHDGIMGYQWINLWEVQRHFVIRRRDGLPAYHVASLCDDDDYGINLIVRGADLLNSTAAQLYLAALTGITGFAKDTQFYHHPLLHDGHGRKLSKSAGSTSLKALRESGISAEELRSKAAAWWRPFL